MTKYVLRITVVGPENYFEESKAVEFNTKEDAEEAAQSALEAAVEFEDLEEVDG